MKKNLFLSSLQHLYQNSQNEAETLPKNVLEEQTNTDVVKFNNAEPVIYLGKGVTFKDPVEAYNYLLQFPEEPISPYYRNTVTKAFLNGSEKGQINSLFKDWKKYKHQIIPKIESFFQQIKSNPEKFPLCKKYVGLVINNVSPIDCLIDGCVDLFYFKFWTLFKYFVEFHGGIGVK